jgi:hypothetical protein
MISPGVVVMVLSLASPLELLPADVLGYRGDGADESVDRDGLFSLIDGGAEAYRALNVRRVAERRYVKAGAADIVVDVFDMGSSADAYGAYHHSMREGPSASVGQESELLGHNLAFWRGQYFVSVVPLAASAEADRAVQAIGAAVAARIPAAGEPPALVRRLPAEGLVRSQVHYFHDAGLLRTRAAFADPDALGLGADTEGVLARYHLGGAASALVLVRYPSDERARRAERALAKQSRLAVRQSGSLLAVVLDAPTPADAAHLLDAVTKPTGGNR